MILVLLGPPGAGKGTQAKLLSLQYGVPHISTGDMFRDHKARGTELGKKVQAIMDAGGLVTDDVTNAMVKDRLSRPDVAPGFLLDGYPRTVPQAEYLDQLLRSMGRPLGRVVSYELRPEFREKAAKNIESFLGKSPEWLELRDGDVRDAASTGEEFQRVVLDMPQPWDTLDALDTALAAGGIVCAFVPTTVQVQTTVLALETHGYVQVETFEILQRTWHVTERSVRPDHRMVGHTGFITVGRRAGRRRAS